MIDSNNIYTNNWGCSCRIVTALSWLGRDTEFLRDILSTKHYKKKREKENKKRKKERQPFSANPGPKTGLGGFDFQSKLVLVTKPQRKYGSSSGGPGKS